MRTRLLLLATAVVSYTVSGCGQPASQGSGSDKVGPPSAQAGTAFAPNDFEASLRWIAAEWLPVATADNKRNDLLADEIADKVKAKFAECVGQKVRWRIAVASVEKSYVRLKRYHLGEYVPKDQWHLMPPMLITAVEGKSPGDLPSNGDWNDISGFGIYHKAYGRELNQNGGLWEGGMTIGKVISKDQAIRLTSGQHVVVTGKIADLVGSGRYSSNRSRMVALCIEEASASAE